MIDFHKCWITVGTPPPEGFNYCICVIGEDHDDVDMEDDDG